MNEEKPPKLQQLSDRRARLEERKKWLKREMGRIEKEIDALHDPLLSLMSVHGLKNLSLTDGITIYPKTELFCSKMPEVPGEAIVAALQKLGLPFLSYSTAKVKEWLKELIDEAVENGEAEALLTEGLISVFPPELRSMFKVHEKTKTVVLGAKAEKGADYHG
ncbi:MAG: hypothetical protein JSW58_08475 [Candidatus Latescibacterota bacterium]|nr:MAG: hypothetical protein JSW58_08475 [Candidatus Latescibacterota bacterium]